MLIHVPIGCPGIDRQYDTSGFVMHQGVGYIRWDRYVVERPLRIALVLEDRSRELEMKGFGHDRAGRLYPSYRNRNAKSIPQQFIEPISKANPSLL